MPPSWVSTSLVQKTHVSLLPEINATHWRCHKCSMLHLWATTPGCVFCNHKRCSSCVPIFIKEKCEIAPRRSYITPKSRPHAQRPLPVPDREYQDSFWRCHCCRTFCAHGDESPDEWKCRACRHVMCWDCSASFRNAALVLRLLPSEGELAATQLEIEDATTTQQNSKALPWRIQAGNKPLAGSGRVATPRAHKDVYHTMRLYKVQRDELQQEIQKKVLALKSSEFQLEAKLQSLNTLQQTHEVLHQKYNALRREQDERVTSNSLRKLSGATTERNASSLSEHVVLTATLRPNVPAVGPTDEDTNESIVAAASFQPVLDTESSKPSSGSERPNTTVDTRIAYLPFRAIHKHSKCYSSQQDDVVSEVATSEDSETRYESDSEMGFTGASSSSDDSQTGWSPESIDTVDSVFISDTAKELTCSYLQELGNRDEGQRKLTTAESASSGTISTSQQQLPAVSSVSTIATDSNVRRVKRNGKRKRDNSDDERPAQKRSKRDDSHQETDLLACPYSKFDRIRYSERNLNEKQYRGCSRRWYPTIHRLKQHLHRVHERPEHHCGRCFADFKSLDLFHVHSRAEPQCSVIKSPFEEKMTHDQVKIISKRGTRKDPLASWYFIYETLFPGCARPESPYFSISSPESVAHFEQWFLGVDLVVRDNFRNRVAEVFRNLPRCDRDVLDMILEECLSEVARSRGPDSSSSPVEPGPSNWVVPEFEIRGTTALEVADELELLGSKQEAVPVEISQENHSVPSTLSLPGTSNDGMVLPSSDRNTDEWVFEYPPSMFDTFEDELPPLEHGSSIDTITELIETNQAGVFDPFEVHSEESMCPETQQKAK